jgi:nucleoid-associated protein
MDLHALILHSIEKRQGEEEANLTLRDESIEVDDLATSFVESVRDTYARKSALQYASFDENEDIYPFQGMMRDYLEDESSFVEFSHRASQNLRSEMERRRMATGGYVAFAHFSDDTEYILCLMIEDTEGFGVDEDLDLLERVHLDIEDLQIASRINVEDWQDGEDGHVSFIPGTKAVSKYFKSFIGVGESDSSLKATRKAQTAIEEYMDEHDYDNDQQAQVTEDVAEYLREAKREGDAATVGVIANIVDPQNTDRFQEHAMSDEYRVDATFAPSPKGIREIEKYEVKSEGVDISFNKSLFRRQVEYRAADSDLIVHEVTPDMLSEDLRREVGVEV